MCLGDAELDTISSTVRLVLSTASSHTHLFAPVSLLGAAGVLVVWPSEGRLEKLLPQM
jgi:hypothetical protein